MVVLILFFILYSIAEGYEDAWYQSINHWRATLRRLSVGLIAIYSSCGIGSSLWLYINSALTLGFTFLVFFNISRNIVARKPWNYIGKTASWDKFLLKFNNTVVWIAFFIGFTLSLTASLFNYSFTIHAEPLINLTHGILNRR
jgi:hypothetical protein